MPKWFRPVGVGFVLAGSGLLAAGGADAGTIGSYVAVAVNVVGVIMATFGRHKDEA